MITLPKDIRQWLKTLFGGAISGGANAALAALGTPVLNATGIVKVESFTGKQLLEMFASGALVGAFMFLRKSPVPDFSSGDTQQFVNPNPPTKAQ